MTLKVFSATGGIEKVCRVAGKALYEIGVESGIELKVFSMHDPNETVDSKYFPTEIFKGFNAAKAKFVMAAVKEGIHSDIVILSHINLLIVADLVKLFSPKTKIVLIAHGIEVWKEVPSWKNNMLKEIDLILPVSQYTKTMMLSLYKLEEEKLKVLNNSLDPYLPPKVTTGKSNELLKRYDLSKDDIILMTLTRLSSKERYKGYDKIVAALKELKPDNPNLKYLVIGKYDQDEKNWFDGMISKLEMTDSVRFTGFIPDEELAEHYNLSDIYIMPSAKEGFGIVFIEAMFYGKPVIAGNADGSVDALANGELGLLVDPFSQKELISAIKYTLNNHESFIPNHDLLMKKFSFQAYKNNLNPLIKQLENNKERKSQDKLLNGNPLL